MKLGPRELAMLQEMGVAWPAGLVSPPAVAAAPLVPDPSEPRRPGSVQAGSPEPSAQSNGAAEPVEVEEAVATGIARHPAAPVAMPADGGAGSSVQVAPRAMGSPDGDSLLPWAESDTLQALQAQVAQCSRCGLCQTRRHTVFGVGHPQAHWMVVGEAPGEQEDRQGEPFVGAAGQLLDRMLAAMGLSRDGGTDGHAAQRVYITNTVKCRPPQNRNPQPQELKACAPVLQAQMALVRPRLVLAMGRFAAQQILGSEEPIGRLRGRVHWLAASGPTSGTASGAASGSVVQAPGLPVVVTYHPAYLLRNPIDKAKAWEDLCLAMDTMAGLGGGEVSGR